VLIFISDTVFFSVLHRARHRAVLPWLSFLAHTIIIQPGETRSGSESGTFPGKLFMLYGHHDALYPPYLVTLDQSEGGWTETPNKGSWCSKSSGAHCLK